MLLFGHLLIFHFIWAKLRKHQQWWKIILVFNYRYDKGLFGIMEWNKKRMEWNQKRME